MAVVALPRYEVTMPAAYLELLTGVAGGLILTYLTKLLGGKLLVPASRVTAALLAVSRAEAEADKWEAAYEEQCKAAALYKEQRDELKQTAYINTEIMRAVHEATGANRAQS